MIATKNRVSRKWLAPLVRNSAETYHRPIWLTRFTFASRVADGHARRHLPYISSASRSCVISFSFEGASGLKSYPLQSHLDRYAIADGGSIAGRIRC
jgi:hypothetical protein